MGNNTEVPPLTIDPMGGKKHKDGKKNGGVGGAYIVEIRQTMRQRSWRSNKQEKMARWVDLKEIEKEM